MSKKPNGRPKITDADRRSIAQLSRPLDPSTRQQLVISPNIRQVEIINRLYETGLYGNSPTEVVNRLFCEALSKYATPITP